jgi:hypothetical protein
VAAAVAILTILNPTHHTSSSTPNSPPSSSPTPSSAVSGNPDPSANSTTTPSSAPTNDITHGTTPSKSVGVVIVDASQYGSTVEVRSYANTISNGTCTFTFSRAGYSAIVRQTAATSGASTSSCGTLDLAASVFPAHGSWNCIVSYASADGKYSGSSTSSTVEVR